MQQANKNCGSFFFSIISCCIIDNLFLQFINYRRITPSRYNGYHVILVTKVNDSNLLVMLDLDMTIFFP